MEALVPYVGGSIVIASILVGILKKWIKNSVAPRFGDLAVLVFLLAVSFILSLIGYFWGKLPSGLTEPISVIFTGAMVIYQALYKAIFKKAFLGKLDEEDLKNLDVADE